ncbi:unnamed protein product [marine sediment metagenome]|uniref:Uncharacterized protein n=1 Tax=marine sediment metagenome TaxID=412755 RepID=X0ZK68_9ZZZZ
MKEKKIHILGNEITNFKNPSIEEIKKGGWKPIYNKKGKIIGWK